MANMRTRKRTADIAKHSAPDAPVKGARRVRWLNTATGVWEHKGWLMPNIIPTSAGLYKYGG